MSYINDINEFPEGIITINLKTTYQHQQNYLIILAKYKNRTYRTVSLCEEINIQFNLITCDGKIGIALTIQSYVLNYNYMYIVLARMDRTETISFKYFNGTALEISPRRKLVIVILANVQKVKY